MIKLVDTVVNAATVSMSYMLKNVEKHEHNEEKHKYIF